MVPTCHSQTGPSQTVRTLVDYLPDGSRILDLGAGRGRNDRYLCDRGHGVVALDADLEAVRHLEQLAGDNPLFTAMHASVLDKKVMGSLGTFDAIIAIGLFHKLVKADVSKVIEYMQEHTIPGGYNAITAFLAENQTDDWQAVQMGESRLWVPELPAKYRGWDIPNFNVERSYKTSESGGYSGKIIKASFIAQKPTVVSSSLRNK